VPLGVPMWLLHFAYFYHSVQYTPYRHTEECLLCFTYTDQQFVGFGGNWIEIAYGTSAGTVCIIVQHPETLGQGPQLFQTFSVHCSPVIRVMISEKHLVSGRCFC